jgi:predicted ATP-binding protein involved in virulence
MNVEYYIKEFGNVREEWFASFKEAPHDDSINRYTHFFTNEFQKPEYLENLVFTKEEGEYSLEKVTEHTYSFENLAFAKSSALNPSNNSNDIERFKRNFKNLIRKPLKEDKYNDIKERIKKADEELKYWGISTLSEIIGQIFPNDFVFFNFRDREALKFLGIEITGRKDELNQYISYQKIIEQDIKPVYQKIIWDKLQEDKRYAIGLEIDQFLSWIYDEYIRVRGNLYIKGDEVLNILHSKINDISIHNYFSIKNIEIDNIQKSNEIYILGENGVGKTLFLQAIILATKWHTIEASDGKTSGKLRDFYQYHENQKLEITIRGNDTNKAISKNSSQDIRTEFILKNEKDESSFIKRSLKNIFAYGVNRSRSDRDEKPDFLTLFGEDKVLKDPIEWLIRLDSLETKIRLFKAENPNQPLPKNLDKPHIPLKIIKEFLTEVLLENIEINIEYNNVIFIENGTKNLTIDQLADGYKSVFVWVIDLIARLSENQPNARKLEDFKGVVLIDELDLFLHVKWAQRIVSDLRRWFKGIQFIITTHSPILVLSASKDAVFYKLYKEDGETKITEPIKGLSDLMLNGLVTSPLFGLSSARSKVFKNVENISNDDYITFKIHQALSKRMEEKPSATEDDFMKWIEEELEKELANQNQ